MDCIVHGITKSQTRVSYFHFHLEKRKLNKSFPVEQSYCKKQEKTKWNEIKYFISFYSFYKFHCTCEKRVITITKIYFIKNAIIKFLKMLL